jgi:hypothetical protein
LERVVNRKIRPLHPFTTPLAEGQALRAGGLFLLQLSLVFWPLAVRIARRQAEARNVQMMLDDLSMRHEAQASLPALPAKRFRSV